jgi:hypothetical protein
MPEQITEQTTEKKRPQNFLREHEAQEMRDSIASCEKMLSRERLTPADRKTTKRRMQRLEGQLKSKALEPVKPEQRDAVAEKVRKLEQEFVPDMPSKDEMFRNPPGAVGKHERWLRRHKSKVLEWKREISRLELGNDDPDVANVERLRPGSGYGDLQMDHTAQIPRQHIFSAPSEQFMQNYDEIDWEKKIDTLVSERVEQELEKRLKSVKK